MLQAKAGATSAIENGEAASSHPQASRRARQRFIIPALLLLVYVLQCAWFIRTQSFTWDEPLHINAGLDAWRNGRFSHPTTADHPPLGQLLATMLVARGDWHVDEVVSPEVRIRAITPDPESMAARTRGVNVVLGVVLGVLLWTTARSVFSQGAANFALALFAFSPALIAHFSLVTTDGIAALMVFVTAIQLRRWRPNPSWGQTALLGVVLGLLLLSKLYTPPFFCLALVFVLVAKPKGWARPQWRWNWGKAGAAVCIALLVLWAGYFFHVSRITTHNGVAVLSMPHHEPVVINTSIRGDHSLQVPAGEYLYALYQVKQRSEIGQLKFVLGKRSAEVSPLLYPVTILLKWPWVVLLLFGWSVALLVKRRVQWPSNVAMLVLFPAGILLLAAISRITVGERHILAAYPFILLFASATWEHVAGQSSSPGNVQHKRRLIAILLLALVVNAADVLRRAPNYLSYFNILVPESRGYKFLSDSNLDWGQGLLALRDYERKHPGEQIYLVYFGSVDPAVYGIRALPLAPHEHRSGTIVVSATHLSGQYLADQFSYRWLRLSPPRTILDHNLFVYDVPPSPER